MSEFEGLIQEYEKISGEEFTPEQIEGMKLLCQKRREEIENLYKVAGHVGFR